MMKMSLITIYVNTEFWQLVSGETGGCDDPLLSNSPLLLLVSGWRKVPMNYLLKTKQKILYKCCVESKTLFRSSLKQKRREKRVSSRRRRRSPVTKMMMMKYKRSWVRKKRQVRKRRGILTNQRRRISKRKSHKRSKNKRKGVYSSCQKKHSIFLFCVINVAIWSNEVFSTRWQRAICYINCQGKPFWT